MHYWVGFLGLSWPHALSGGGIAHVQYAMVHSQDGLVITAHIFQTARARPATSRSLNGTLNKQLVKMTIDQ